MIDHTRQILTNVTNQKSKILLQKRKFMPVAMKSGGKKVGNHGMYNGTKVFFFFLDDQWVE